MNKWLLYDLSFSNLCFFPSHFLVSLSVLEQRGGDGSATKRGRQYGGHGWAPAKNSWVRIASMCKYVCVCAYVWCICAFTATLVHWCCYTVVYVCYILNVCVYSPAERGRANTRSVESFGLQTVHRSIKGTDCWAQEWGEVYTQTCCISYISTERVN